MVERNRTLWNRLDSVTNSGVNGTEDFLPPRSESVYRITGYRMALSTNSLIQANGDFTDFGMALQTVDTVWDVDNIFVLFSPQGQVGAETPMRRESFIDGFGAREQNTRITAVGSVPTVGSYFSAWTNTDLLVPAVFVNFFGQVTQTANVGWLAVIEYEIVKASVALLSAVNLAWGAGERAKV